MASEAHAPLLCRVSVTGDTSTVASTSTAASTPSAGYMWARNRSLEFPDNRLTDEETKCLAALKVYIKENPLKPPKAVERFDDFDLAKFVVVEKCDVKKCHSRMQNFVNFIALYKLDEVALEDVNNFFVNDLQMSSLAPTLDKEGRYTLFRDGGALLASHINTERKLQLFIKGGFAMMDLVTDTIAATRKGVVHVTDMRTFGWKNFDRSMTKNSAAMQCYPVTFTRMLMVNPPWYMSAMMSIVKVFLKKEVIDRLKFVWVGKNVAKDKMLFTYVERHQVPENMGGTLTESYETWLARMGFE